MHSLINFKVCGDDRGLLVAIENNKQIPFDIKRVFYVYNTSDQSARGCHANRNSQFVLIAVNGSCKIKVMEKDETTVITLDNPYTGLWLDKMVWKEMYDFSEGAVLLVLSSEMYDKNEYIVDYNSYIEELR
jgi:dTDP-4-dehydrorhamnose 3,5-epimerase-like enzyme